MHTDRSKYFSSSFSILNIQKNWKNNSDYFHPSSIFFFSEGNLFLTEQCFILQVPSSFQSQQHNIIIKLTLYYDVACTSVSLNLSSIIVVIDTNSNILGMCHYYTLTICPYIKLYQGHRGDMSPSSPQILVLNQIWVDKCLAVPHCDYYASTCQWSSHHVVCSATSQIAGCMRPSWILWSHWLLWHTPP